MLFMPIIYFVIYVVFGSREGFRDNMLFGWELILGSHFMVTILFWSLKSQTLGLKAYELKLVSKNGKKANILQLIFRYFATLSNFILLFTFLVPFFNKNRLTLQDILSYTCIIDETQK